MSTAPADGLIGQLSWNLITVHAGDECEVVQGDPARVLGISATDFSEGGLAARVVGEAPTPCAWQDPCESSRYLLRNSLGGAQWVESRSAKAPDGRMMVATRVAGPTDTLKQVATLGRLTLGGSLLGPLAHEVNNFVQGLSAVVYLFQDCVEQGDPIEADFVEDLSLVVTELASIGQGIQEFARQEVSGPEPVELPKVIDQAAAFLRSAGKLKTVELSINVSSKIPRLFWPRAELDFVISALLSNAADAALNNTEVQAVQLVSAGSDEFFTIEIKDSGGSFGLTESSLPFRTTGPEHRNLGLGLSIVSAIVASHGGKISAEKHELGNIVRVTLPLATEPKVALEQ